MKEELRGARRTFTRKSRRQTWKKVLSVLCCAALLCATCGLTPPAMAREETVFCGKTEHTHGEACYTQTGIKTSIVPVCTPESPSIHQHNSACYDANGALWCTLPEIWPHTHGEDCYAPAEPAHVHTEECYGVARGQQICPEQEREGHAHSLEAGCYRDEPVLVCQTPQSVGHVHDESCYTVETLLTCATPVEDGAHTHGEGCYTANTTLVCTVAEGEGAHAHGESCYETQSVLVCTIQEDAGHQHNDECYEKVQGDLICTLSTEPAQPTLICGKQETGQAMEHVHSDACFVTVEEAPELTCAIPDGQDGHAHTALCYGTWELTCTLEEHTHTLVCYSDKTADLENAKTWEATLPRDIPEAWDEALLAVAKSQLGYHESERNYEVNEEGKAKGYTRYGAWSGMPYEDWCAMFVSFCLNYAGIPKESFPQSSSCVRLMEALRNMNLLWAPEGYDPMPGDLVFFDWEDDGGIDHVGLVAKRIENEQGALTEFKTIEGNADNQVKYRSYAVGDTRIWGYGELPENPNITPAATPTAMTSEEPEDDQNVSVNSEPEETPTVDSNATATIAPSATPTIHPSATATIAPSATPTVHPSATATTAPSATPTIHPSATATNAPSATPTIHPSATATNAPSVTATIAPSVTPTVDPSATATIDPSVTPTIDPNATATIDPSATPTIDPNATATIDPSVTPTVDPSAKATIDPNATPTVDPMTADVETAEIWEATLPTPIPENRNEAVVAVAKSQLGYQESQTNFIEDEMGNRKGYTRYGEWYGEPYGDWNAKFVSFCLNYAGVSTETFPQDGSCASWVQALQGAGLFQTKDVYVPNPGDLIFFDNDGDGVADYVGVVSEILADGTGMSVIAGDSANGVHSATYNGTEDAILGYGALNAPVPEPTVDPSTVDVETAEVWEATLPNPMPEDWDDALVAVANSQLGYKESEVNVIMDEAGNPKGYTRYGAWYGEPYADWNAMFVSFCLNYAGVPVESFPRDVSSASWVETLSGAGLFQTKDAYAPKPGDLVFFDNDGDSIADRVGVATEMADGSITIIEGDAENQVQSASYTPDDATILGYGALPETPRVEYQCYQKGIEFTAIMKKTPDLPENAKLVVKWLPGKEIEAPYQEQAAAILERIKEEGLNPYVANLYKVYLEADGQEIIPQGNVDLSIKLHGYEYPVLFHNEAICLSDAGIQSTLLDKVGVDRVGGLQTRLSMLCAVLCSRRPDISTLAAHARDGGPAAEDIAVHKTIDAFRDGDDNPDTTLDDTATDEEKEDLYRLYLDAQMSNNQVPVDLLLVIDESGSMHQDYATTVENYQDMWDAEKQKDIYRDQAVQLVLNGVYDEDRDKPFSPEEFKANKDKGLISKFLAMNPDNLIAVVGFYGEEHVDPQYTPYAISDNPDARTIQGTWTHDVIPVHTQGQQWNATNYCAGLREAMKVLDNAPNNGHRKIMLFLSDGVPTLHLMKNDEGAYQKGGNGQADGGNYWLDGKWAGSGYDTTKSVDFFNDEFRTAHPDVTVYTIGFSETINKTEDGTGPDALVKMAEKGGGAFFAANSTDELKKDIESIMYKTLYSDLSIQDKLSANVDLYTAKPDYKVTMVKRDENGNVVSETTLYENGGITEQGKGKIKSVGPDSTNRTVTAEFEDDYILEVGCTYTLSFNVKTSGTAYQDYAAKGSYPDTGHSNTDYGTNATSSGKGGYFSNTEATMTCKLNDQEIQKTYPHPVVQVSVRELTVEKKWFDFEGNDVTENATGSVQFKLMQKAYYDVPSFTPTPATVTVNSKCTWTSWSLSEGWQDYEETKTLTTKEAQVGPELTLTFTSDTKVDKVNVTDTATGAALPGGTLTQKSYSYWDGYEYTYTFTVTGDTTLGIEYSNTNRVQVSVSDLAFEPQMPVEGGRFYADGEIYTRDHTDGIYTISSENGWKEVIKNLPKSGMYQGDDPDFKDKELYYTYYVEEIPVEGYTTTCVNNESDGTSTITIQNRSNTKTVDEMPETGGAGTIPYTMGGLLLMAGSILLYKNKMRRKEGFASV